MKPRSRRLLCVGLLGLLMLGCGWGVVDSRRPPPEPLLQASGSVTSVRLGQRRGRNEQVYFTLADQAREFNYAPGLPGIEEVMARLRVGSRVDLRYGPRGGFDIWAFRLDGRDVLVPEQRLQSVRGGGYVAAALLAGLALLAAWLWRLMAPGVSKQ